MHLFPSNSCIKFHSTGHETFFLIYFFFLEFSSNIRTSGDIYNTQIQITNSFAFNVLGNFVDNWESINLQPILISGFTIISNPDVSDTPIISSMYSNIHLMNISIVGANYLSSNLLSFTSSIVSMNQINFANNSVTHDYDLIYAASSNFQVLIIF